MNLNDKKLSEMLSPDIAENYTTALDFIDQKPDYTLIKFRKVLEGIVLSLAKKNNIDLDDYNLSEKITHLADCQVLNHAQLGQFHDLRTLGNAGAHAPSAVPPKSESDGFENVIRTQKKSLIASALKARKLLIEIMSDAYSMLHTGAINNVAHAQVGHQRYKEIIYEGVTSVCATAKLKAGLVLHEILYEHSIQNSFLVSDDFASHIDALRLQIFAFFDSACSISAYHRSNGEISLDSAAHICRHADPEALYNYFLISSHPDFKGQYFDTAIARLKASADKGNAQACGAFAAHLYDIGNYDKSYNFLLKGAAEDDVDSLCLLYEYFAQGKAINPDIEKAKSFINKALDLRSPDAIAAMGEYFYRGIGVKKDLEKARSLLEEAERKGSMRAHNTLIIMKMEQLPALLEEEMEKMLNALKPIANIANPIPKFKKGERNKPCPCGSEKKFKKCCWLTQR